MRCQKAHDAVMVDYHLMDSIPTYYFSVDLDKSKQHRTLQLINIPVLLFGLYPLLWPFSFFFLGGILGWLICCPLVPIQSEPKNVRIEVEAALRCLIGSPVAMAKRLDLCVIAELHFFSHVHANATRQSRKKCLWRGTVSRFIFMSSSGVELKYALLLIM